MVKLKMSLLFLKKIKNRVYRMFLNCILDAVVLAVSVFVFVSVRAKNSKTAVYKLMIHVTRYRKM